MEKARRLRGVRVAMLAAACIAVSAGFGLHPEAASGGAPQGLSLHGPTAAERGPHDCLACRAHRPIVAAPTPAEIVGARASTALPVASLPLAIRVFPLFRLDGRSPPAAS